MQNDGLDKKANFIKIKFIDEEEDTPPKIIGMNTEHIMKYTINLVEKEIQRIIDEEKERGVDLKLSDIYILAFHNTFMPPSKNAVEICAKMVISVLLNAMKTGFGGITLWAENESLAVSSSQEIGKDSKKASFHSDDIFRITDSKKWKRSWEIIRDIKNTEVMEKAFIVSPETTFISLDSEIGEGTIIFPGTFIISCNIGNNVTIGQGTHIIGTKVADRVQILPYSYIEGAEIDEDVSIGPFARIRPKTKVKKGAKIGNFAEIKNSEIGEGSKVQHFSYIGDTKMGKDINIGAGTVTCNYDGYRKNTTEISDYAFIGSGTMLVAPLKIGKNAYIGAGSTITQDVPQDSLALERADTRIIPGWRKRKQTKIQNESEMKEKEKNEKEEK